MSRSKSAAAACVLQGWTDGVRISSSRVGVSDVIDYFLWLHRTSAFTATELCEALALGNNEFHMSLTALTRDGVIVEVADGLYAYGGGLPQTGKVAGRPRPDAADLAQGGET